MRHLWHIRKKRRLYTSLIFDFLFIHILFLLFMLVMIVLFIVYLFNSAHSSESISLDAHSYVQGSQTEEALARLERAGGWLEVIDKEGRVLQVKGTQRDGIRQYTSQELLTWLGNAVDQPYYYAIAEMPSPGDSQFLLLKIARDQVSVENRVLNPATVELPAASTGQRSLDLYFYSLLAVMALMVVLYSYWVARRIKKPLDKLMKGLVRISNGDYAFRVEFEAEREFNQIRDMFNTMAAVIERTTREKQLAEESKQRLIVDLSHDLKTPVTSIRGFAQLLSAGTVADEEQRRKYADYIYRKSIRVTDMIQSMLELLKLDSPDYQIDVAAHDAGAFLREMAADLYGDIEQRQFALQLDIPEHPIQALFHSDQLARAVSNLIGNALQYNPPGTRLRLAVSEEPAGIVIQVADTGIGIPEEMQSRIFDPFVRGDKSRRGDGGSGLGLSIAKRIVEKMNGTLVLGRSKEEATIFTIRLPKA
ncbi:HAMP domain-containing sensor histidine kinase [Paenibacillus filicis]|uniref:histidine kinase n=1 Tax=Paenibacillus filicis TaxID=669464 RepID=A0ABU9DEC7_9BACL